MKLYTKRGDDGETDLFGGQRVAKDQRRVEAYGSVDELNAALGLAIAACGSDAGESRVGAVLQGLQHRLFDLGADLATPPGTPGAGKVRRIVMEDVEPLEAQIDELDAALPPLRAFILPGGTELAARLHVARTVARRAERRVVSLMQAEEVGEPIAKYLNRISDLLFVLARAANQAAGVADVAWQKG
ncbi:MAG: cob(I)yrinic acid a,c-diamide adenosyltransferase [Planctomycetota bacterium]